MGSTRGRWWRMTDGAACVPWRPGARVGPLALARLVGTAAAKVRDFAPENVSDTAPLVTRRGPHFQIAPWALELSS
jgi:hypothetical protein